MVLTIERKYQMELKDQIDQLKAIKGLAPVIGVDTEVLITHFDNLLNIFLV